MKIILSSFGFNDDLHSDTYFHRIPPVSFHSFGPEFVPDYPVILLFDQFVIDGGCLELIRQRPFFKAYVSVIEALNSSGRLEIVDFPSIISPRFGHFYNPFLFNELQRARCQFFKSPI